MVTGSRLFTISKVIAIITFCLLCYKIIEKFVKLYEIRIAVNSASTSINNEIVNSISSEIFSLLNKSTYGAVRKVKIVEIVEILQYDVTRPVPEEADGIECILLKNANPPYSVCLSAEDGMSQSIQLSLSWENDVQAFIKQFFTNNPTAVFFDLGMNIGVHSLYAAIQNPKIQIVGVEPYPYNIMVFHKAAHLNKVQSRFTVIVAAVSNRRGYAMATGNYSGLTINGNSTLNSGFHVNTITINDLIPFFKKKKVLLKMDIERSECHVFENAYTIFANIDISAIIMEIGATVKEGPCCFEGMLKFLSDRNYKGYYFDGHIVSYLPYRTDSHIQLNFSNWKNWDFNVNVYFKKFY